MTPTLDEEKSNTELANLECISLQSIKGDDESIQKAYFDQNQIDERTKIEKIGQNLADNGDRIDLVKKPRHEVLHYSSRDTQYPHLKYFYSCKKSESLVLPILEKVIAKTILLQNYAISEGVCHALAQAAPSLDSSQINRINFTNNGISDASFAEIITGLA